ncbi:MAG TPA: DMT family transporter [Candidatus Competibacteraceae bacterium]|nr:DMT family transporter [Candidatus Competibacteraceae bacterium]
MNFSLTSVAANGWLGFSLILAALIWGSSFTATKSALATLDPVMVAFSRLVIAMPFLLLLWRRFGPIWYQRGDWKFLLSMALFEPFLYFILEAHALRLTSSAAAATIIALLPLAVALTAYLVLREQVARRLWAGLFIALAGTLLLIWSGQATALAPNPLLGNLLEGFAMLTAVGYTLLVKQLSARYSALFLTATQTFLGAILLLPFAWNSTAGQLQTAPWQTWLILLYLGTMVSIGAYFLYNRALSKLPANQVVLYISLIPVFAALFDWLFLGETLNWLQSSATLVVAAGVIYSQRPEPDRTAILAFERSP